MRVMSATREQGLIEAARGGDEAAFQGIVEPYRGELHAHCYRILGPVPGAEDPLQGGIPRAWRGPPRFGGPRPLPSGPYPIPPKPCPNRNGRGPKRVLPIDYGPA